MGSPRMRSLQSALMGPSDVVGFGKILLSYPSLQELLTYELLRWWLSELALQDLLSATTTAD